MTLALWAVNLALTVSAWVKLILHGPVPMHGPLQPMNVDPLAAVAVNVTLVPLAKAASQVLPQSIWGDADVVLPTPLTSAAIVLAVLVITPFPLPDLYTMTL